MTIKVSLTSNIDEPVITVLHKVEHPTSFQDSLTIGTPSRGGEIKVYGDFNNPDQFKTKLLQAIELKEFANSRIYPPKDQQP